MNKNNKIRIHVVLLAAAITAGSLLGACKKKDDGPSQNASAFPTPSYPQPSDADVVLVAVRASAPSPIKMPSIPGMPANTEIVMDIGMGIAVFKDNAKAGKVLLNDTELKFANGAYMWQPNFSNITDPSSVTGINLSGSIKWAVTNPDISKTLSSLPGKPTVTSAKTITRSQGYTLTNQTIGGAQKVLYGIYSANGKSVLKEQNGNSTQCSFTAEELAALGSTKNGIIQANAYTMSSETVNGKKVYYVNQSSYSVTGVTIN